MMMMTRLSVSVDQGEGIMGPTVRTGAVEKTWLMWQPLPSPITAATAYISTLMLFSIGCLFCFFTPGPTPGFCPGGSLAHSRRGDLGGVAGFLPPKPVEEVTRNLAML